MQDLAYTRPQRREDGPQSASTTAGGGLHVVVLDRYAGRGILSASNDLALDRALLHTSPRREECQVDQEERAQQVYTPLRLTGRQLQWAGAAVAVLTIAILIGYPFGITLWDWMKLLVVPVVIAAGGLWFNQQQQYRQLAIQDEHAQDEALQAYLDQLTQLLVTEKDHELIKMRVEDDVRQVIQARSEPLLRSVDSTRKWSVILFLSVMGLLARDRPLVSLAGANLEGVDGHDAPLQGIDLGQANLSGADLSGADLSGVAGITNEELERQAYSLEDATMPNGQKYEDWLKDKEDRKEDAENG
jgi:hypothetical protein